MWLYDDKVVDSVLCTYRESLLNSCPNHVVIYGLFNESKLDDVLKVLHNSHCWQIQQHTYSALYVDSVQWEKTSNEHSQ